MATVAVEGREYWEHSHGKDCDPDGGPAHAVAFGECELETEGEVICSLRKQPQWQEVSLGRRLVAGFLEIGLRLPISQNGRQKLCL